MGILQDIPTQEQLTGLLQGVIGDANAGTGVAGVLRLLESVDAQNLSASFSASLGGTSRASLEVDTSGLTGSALAPLQEALAAFASDPAELTRSLSQVFEQLQAAAGGLLNGDVDGALQGLRSIEGLVPANTGAILGDLANRMTGLRGEFLDGAFADLRVWSGQVEGLYAEIRPILEGPPEDLVGRVLAWLGQKIAALVEMALPQRLAQIPRLAARLEEVLSADLTGPLAAIHAGLVASLDAARLEFEGGNFTNRIALQAAQASFDRFAEALSALVDRLEGVFGSPAFAAQGLERTLAGMYEHLMAIEIVDLGDIRSKFTEAIQSIEAQVRGLDLQAPRRAMDELFASLRTQIERFNLQDLIGRLDALQAQFQQLLASLDGALVEAVASIRALFSRLRSAVQGVVGTLGSTGPDGQFHFFIEREIEDFLGKLRVGLQETLQPALEDLRSRVGQALQAISRGLQEVQSQIEQVRAELDAALQGVNAQLRELDVRGMLERVAGELRSLLDTLGQFDFDPVVTPVVAELEEMRDALAGIDLSSLNEFTIGALKVSVEVVVQLDFSTQITDVLLAEFDKLLEIPLGALHEVESQVEGALSRFAALAPDAILTPLRDLFEPVSAALDSLSLERLLEPLDDWYAGMRAQLESLQPSRLLAPLFAAYDELAGLVGSLRPSTLIQPLGAQIDGLLALTRGIDLSGIADEINGVIGQARAAIERISPDQLLNPLVGVFETLMAALERFDPAALLQPLKDIYNAITAPLAELSAEAAELISQAFRPLRDLLDFFNPEFVFERVGSLLGDLRRQLGQVNPAGLVAGLVAPYTALNASFQAHAGPVEMAASVDALNPLRSPALTAALDRLRQLLAGLDAAAAGAPAALAARYRSEIRPRLELIIPVWARHDLTPASIRRAFELANPASIDVEVRSLYDAILDQIRNFDPRLLQEELRRTFQELLDNLLGIDAGEITGRVEAVVNALAQRLEVFNLNMISAEVDGLAAEVTGLVSGLDPRPIAARLDGAAGELLAAVDALRPSSLLAELADPFDQAREIVRQFDPQSLVDALQSVFDEIRVQIEAIDIGVLLQPLVDILRQLRSALEDALRRTETAFNAMLAAIPV